MNSIQGWAGRLVDCIEESKTGVDPFDNMNCVFLSKVIENLVNKETTCASLIGESVSCFKFVMFILMSPEIGEQ